MRNSRRAQLRAMTGPCGSAVLLLLATLSPRHLPAQLNASAAASDEGRALLAASGCAGCHGDNGAGTDAGPRLAAERLTLSEFQAAVRRSVRTMPAFSEDVLPDRSLTRIFAFLESQQAPAGPPGRAETGARLFAAYGCYSCHANQAQGGMHGPRLGPDPITPARFFWYLRHPTGNMPPYSAAVMTDQDVADIYAFVESLPRPPPLGSIDLLAP